jgi:hypothetical protein
MDTLILISVILFLFSAFIWVMALLKAASDYDDASDEIYTKHLNQLIENEKIEKHKKMMEDADINSEVIDNPKTQ